MNRFAGAVRHLESLFFSGFVAPLLVISAGVLVHAGFSVTATADQVVYGGPEELDDTVLDIILPTAELLAINQIEGVYDEIEESEPFIHPVPDSLSADDASMFGASTKTMPNGTDFYVVKPGDTLFSVAHEHGTTENALARANGLSLTEPLIVGDQLYLSAPVAAPVTTNQSYRVAGSYLPKGFMWPATGSIGPAHGTYAARDIPNQMGTPVVASGTGTVIEASYGWNGGYGNRIIIDHPEGGVQTLYSHLQDFVVTVGQSITKGEVIGYMGSTGKSTGSHVHFEVRWQ